jgi:hypothetical protein
MHHLVDEPNLQCPFGADILAGENQVECIPSADEARQTLRASHAGDESELHFRQRQYRFGMVGGDAIAAGERQFQPAAETCAVNCRDNGDTRLLEQVQKPLPKPAGVLRVLLVAEFEELLDVGAGDEYVGLAARKHRRTDRAVTLGHLEDALDLHTQPAVDFVDGVAWSVEGHDENAGAVLDEKRVAHAARSTIIACPIPPAAHTVIKPNSASRRASSLQSVVRMRPPVAPKGCPMEIEPPITLSLERSTSPTGFE